MHFRYLGNSGLKISEITYGNWLTHGSQLENEQATACVHAALDAGISACSTPPTCTPTPRPRQSWARPCRVSVASRWRSSPRSSVRPARRVTTIDTVTLAPAERADIMVQMNLPGVWIFGSTKEDDRKIGLGVVVEYANQEAPEQWRDPPATAWDYTVFGSDQAVPQPDHQLELLFEKVPGGHGGYNRWMLNGASWPNTRQLLQTEVGKRYRLVMTNKSGDNRPVHLHRHTLRSPKLATGKRQVSCRIPLT